MFWSTQIPILPIHENEEYNKNEPTLFSSVINNRNEPHKKITGGRRSGKTQALINECINKKTDGFTLVIIPWTTERKRWEECLQNAKKRNTIVHTPDSLARHLITQWSTAKKTDIKWVTEETIPVIKSTITPASNNIPIQADNKKVSTTSAIEYSNINTSDDYHNEEEFAKTLLQKGVMTASAAHWLLQQEIEDFLKRGLLPRKVEKLIMDEPNEWDEEASNWCKKIPATAIIEANKERDLDSIYLPGTILPNCDFVRNQYRWIEVEVTDSERGEWACRTINKIKSQTPICIISQEDPKTREKWRVYLQARTKNKIEVHTASSIEGKTFSHIVIPSLKRNWGSPKTARSWLDLVASKALTKCIARIKIGNQPHWIPEVEENKNILGWSV